MCGRYASTTSSTDLAAAFAAIDATDGGVRPDYNVAPTRQVPTVLIRSSKDDKAGEEQEQRLVKLMKWGLIPSWAKTASIGSKMINARSETLAEKPSYKRAFAKRRCLIPADGYYEWTTLEDGTKQPYFHKPADGSLFVMAGLYEIWKDPEEEDPDARVWSCTVITTTAADDVGHIHDRSPMVLDQSDWERWLDPSFNDLEKLATLMKPAVAGKLEIWPVSKDVNSVKNNKPELLNEIEDPEQPTLL